MIDRSLSLPASEPAIRVRGVRHVYRARAGAVSALAGIDLDVPAGELLAILGPSGCGKSTLLRMLAGLLEPTAGVVQLAGQRPAVARASHGIGWLAQDDGLLPWRTVADNVALALTLGRRGRAASDRVMAALEQVRLADAARRYPGELSGGMRQRAALARALVAEPPFLFLDEPFANLDELTRERLGDLLLDVRAALVAPSKRPTTLLVTHSVVEAVRLADRILVLSGRPARVLDDAAVPLARPRRYGQPGFGAWVERLTSILAGRTTVEPPVRSLVRA
ncbi:MAG: ATP-binding cassette domain-containing protein [Chloroflexota bacterium]|nr:ATP-binding cassette domain-containing protein [Chloroflexota bacterium]